MEYDDLRTTCAAFSTDVREHDRPVTTRSALAALDNAEEVQPARLRPEVSRKWREGGRLGADEVERRCAMSSRKGDRERGNRVKACRRYDAKQHGRANRAAELVVSDLLLAVLTHHLDVWHIWTAGDGPVRE